LNEKQKLRFYYGLSEKQLTRYVSWARKAKESTGRVLVQRLEMRLDNILYRIGWRPTLPYARQLVNHGHILVRQKRVTIPSFSCRPNNVITVQQSQKIRAIIKENLQVRNQKLPPHLILDTESLTCTVSYTADHRETPLKLNDLLVIEYYSNRLLILVCVYTYSWYKNLVSRTIQNDQTIMYLRIWDFHHQH
jgi:small subunit ribosomal protein S4